MLFQVTMTVRIPADANPAEITGLKVTEKARCQELMRDGRWRHIWRVVGQYKMSAFSTLLTTTRSTTS
jgi:muconolactone D-isomerase